MAKNRLRNAAVKIGSAVGRVDGRLTKRLIKQLKRHTWRNSSLSELSKQVDALKKQLEKSTKT